MSRVCAVIPTCNRADLISICLESLLRQTRPVDEIIVVDDGSTDHTLQVLAAYGSRVKVVSQANGGKAAAMNTGLQYVTADYVWFCDDDDIAADDGIAPLVVALDEDPSLAFAYGMHEKFNGDDLDGRWLPAFWGQPVPDRAIINILGNLYPFQMASLVRREIFDQIGPFDTTFRRAQDVEISIRLALAGKSIYVPHIVFYQRGHTGFRGNPQQQITQKEAQQKAVIFDQKAILKHQDKLTLAEVTPSFAEALPSDLKRRVALLQRASIYARHALWSLAITDLTAAASSASAPALPQELAIAQYAVMKPQMWDLLALDQASIDALAKLRLSTAYGKSITSAFVQPMPWHIRTALQSERQLAWRRFQLTKKIIGLTGLTSLILKKALA